MKQQKSVFELIVTGLKIGIIFAFVITCMAVYSYFNDKPSPSTSTKEEPKKVVAPVKEVKDYKSWSYVLNNINFDAIKKSNYDVVIIDIETNNKLVDAETIKSLKPKKVFAYASLGQAENYRSYWKKEWDKTPPVWIGKENRYWKDNFEIKNLMAPEWVEISKRTVDMIIAMGYDGVLVNGLPETTQAVDFLNEIVSYIKSKKPTLSVFVQDSENLSSDARFMGLIDGIVKQGLIFSRLSDGTSGKVNGEEYITRTIETLKKFKQNNKQVFVVEFVSGDLYATAKKRIEENSFIPYSAPLTLNVLR